MCRGLESVIKRCRGGTEGSVHFACEEEKITEFESGAYVSKTWKERREQVKGVVKKMKEKQGGERKREKGARRKRNERQGVTEVGHALT